jgi:type II secretory pathway pseudopilin PulG
MRIGSQPRGRAKREHGYVLLTLLLMVALMAIVAATVVTSLKFEMQRDREEEMIHRGVQYTRAIKAYYKKFNRYPAKIEDLENTNQLRFLRKRYKDPLTGKDFRILHYGEAKMSLSGMGGMIPGANMVGPNGQLTGAGGLQNSALGANGALQNAAAFGQAAALAQTAGFGQNPGFAQNPNSPFGQNAQNNPSDSSQPGSENGTDSQASGNGSPGNPTGPGGMTGIGGNPASTAQFGGAPIVGVASTSKDKTIREFDKKKKYNEWQFVYDPTLDRGGLITTPYQPQLAMQGMVQGMQNANGQNGATPGNGFGNGLGTSSGFGNSGGFGNSSGFGNSNGFGNSPGGMQNSPNSPGGFSNPSQPSTPPQQ